MKCKYYVENCSLRETKDGNYPYRKFKNDQKLEKDVKKFNARI